MLKTNTITLLLLIIIVYTSISFAALKEIDSEWIDLEVSGMSIKPENNWEVQKKEYDKLYIINKGIDILAEFTITAAPTTIPAFQSLVKTGHFTTEKTNITIVTQRGTVNTNYSVRKTTGYGKIYDEIYSLEPQLLQLFKQRNSGTYRDIIIQSRMITNFHGPALKYYLTLKKFDKGSIRQFHGILIIRAENRFLFYFFIECPADNDLESLMTSLSTTFENIRIDKNQSVFVNTEYNYSMHIPTSWSIHTNNLQEIVLSYDNKATVHIRCIPYSRLYNIEAIKGNQRKIDKLTDRLREIDVLNWKTNQNVTMIKSKNTIHEINGMSALHDLARYQFGENQFDEHNILLSHNTITYHIIITKENIDKETASDEEKRIDKRIDRHVEEMINSFAAY